LQTMTLQAAAEAAPPRSDFLPDGSIESAGA